jgi:hypothetical protein
MGLVILSAPYWDVHIASVRFRFGNHISGNGRLGRIPPGHGLVFVVAGLASPVTEL